MGKGRGTRTGICQKLGSYKLRERRGVIGSVVEGVEKMKGRGEGRVCWEVKLCWKEDKGEGVRGR